jgi:hypothetical protein
MHPVIASRRERSSWTIVGLNTVTLAVVGLSSYGFYRLVLAYGWDGALRYLWEGDPIPQQIREYIDALNIASNTLEEHDKIITALEEGLERARLDTVDESRPSKLLNHWRMNLPESQHDLQTHLAKASSDLDKLATEIDQVPNKEQVRHTKKELSIQVVDMMTRADVLIDFFKRATDDRTNL